MPAEIAPSRSPVQSCAAPVRIRREQGEGVNVVTLESGGISEFHLTVTPLKGESIGGLAKRVAGLLHSRDAMTVRLVVFGRAAEYPAALETLRHATGDPGLPVAWVDGAGCTDNAVAGIKLHAVAGTMIHTNDVHDMMIRIFDDAAGTHCIVNSILPARMPAPPARQTQEVFDKLDAGLATAGMTLKDVARTWFYLDDMLSWYGDFNRVRNEVFARNRLSPVRLPASTGVGGRNARGAALIASAWGFRPRDATCGLEHFAPSPEQCPATAYGSAFSRAVELRGPDFRRLLASGTASIARGGKTEHIGDTQAQIERSMEVMEAILKSRGMTFADTAFATAFIKHPADAPLFADWLARRGLESMPVVLAHCDICRDNLLFEIELEAVQTAG